MASPNTSNINHYHRPSILLTESINKIADSEQIFSTECYRASERLKGRWSKQILEIYDNGTLLFKEVKPLNLKQNNSNINHNNNDNNILAVYDLDSNHTCVYYYIINKESEFNFKFDKLYANVIAINITCSTNYKINLLFSNKDHISIFKSKIKLCCKEVISEISMEVLELLELEEEVHDQGHKVEVEESSTVLKEGISKININEEASPPITITENPLLLRRLKNRSKTHNKKIMNSKNSTSIPDVNQGLTLTTTATATTATQDIPRYQQKEEIVKEKGKGKEKGEAKVKITDKLRMSGFDFDFHYNHDTTNISTPNNIHTTTTTTSSYDNISKNIKDDHQISEDNVADPVATPSLRDEGWYDAISSPISTEIRQIEAPLLLDSDDTSDTISNTSLYSLNESTKDMSVNKIEDHTIEEKINTTDEYKHKIEHVSLGHSSHLHKQTPTQKEEDQMKMEDEFRLKIPSSLKASLRRRKTSSRGSTSSIDAAIATATTTTTTTTTTAIIDKTDNKNYVNVSNARSGSANNTNNNVPTNTDNHHTRSGSVDMGGGKRYSIFDSTTTTNTNTANTTNAANNTNNNVPTNTDNHHTRSGSVDMGGGKRYSIFDSTTTTNTNTANTTNNDDGSNSSGNGFDAERLVPNPNPNPLYVPESIQNHSLYSLKEEEEEEEVDEDNGSDGAANNTYYASDDTYQAGVPDISHIHQAIPFCIEGNEDDYDDVYDKKGKHYKNHHFDDHYDNQEYQVTSNTHTNHQPLAGKNRSLYLFLIGYVIVFISIWYFFYSINKYRRYQQ